MKKCRRCSKPATLHITELRDGAVQELHLCEGCAQEYLHNPEMSQEPDEADQLAAKLTEATGVEDLRELDHLACPNCGITFREFRSQGRLGCPHDYIAFEAELMPLLENIHGETQHTGKFPRRAPDVSQRQYELIRLRSQLRTAVGEEAYEEAARLRDAIQTLERELGSQREAQ
jgi:protein arginine kinase activator